ncbi:MAG: hypothetical protein JWO03_2792 [Bacteroidetes bacterium]|nr:hypothetical protein [Bacteroidota bacterium]
MRKAIIFGIMISVILMSCSKTNNSPFIGTYNGSGASNTISRVTIGAAGSTNLQVQLQVQSGGVYYTFATIQNAVPASGTSLSVNENGLIFGSSETYHFVGTGALSGNNLTLSGSATNVNNSSDVRLYYFTGSK